MRNQWSEPQQACVEELHCIGPGCGRSPKNTQKCQVLQNKYIALKAQMNACPGDALQQDGSPSLSQPDRQFNPCGSAPSLKDQIGTTFLSQSIDHLKRIISLAIDRMGCTQPPPHIQTLIMSTYQYEGCRAAEAGYLHSEQTDSSITYHNHYLTS